MSQEKTTFSTRPFGPSLFRFANMSPSAQYRVVAGQQVTSAQSNEEGELLVELAPSLPVEVEITRW